MENLWKDLERYLETTEKPCIVCKNTKLEILLLKAIWPLKSAVNAVCQRQPAFLWGWAKTSLRNYFIDRQTEETLRAQRGAVYTIDRDWLLNFIDGGSILDVGCSGGFFLSHFDDEKWTKYGVGSLRIQLSTRDKYGIDVKVGNLVDLDFDDSSTFYAWHNWTSPRSCRCNSQSSQNCEDWAFFVTATPVGNCFSLMSTAISSVCSPAWAHPLLFSGKPHVVWQNLVSSSGASTINTTKHHKSGGISNASRWHWNREKWVW